MISINQLDYQATGAGESQCKKILDHLRRNLGEWVAMPELVEISGSYVIHSRIADLRAAGCRIEHKNEREPGSRTQKSFYKLTLSVPQPETSNLQPST